MIFTNPHPLLPTKSGESVCAAAEVTGDSSLTLILDSSSSPSSQAGRAREGRNGAPTGQTRVKKKAKRIFTHTDRRCAWKSAARGYLFQTETAAALLSQRTESSRKGLLSRGTSFVVISDDKRISCFNMKICHGFPKSKRWPYSST